MADDPLFNDYGQADSAPDPPAKAKPAAVKETDEVAVGNPDITVQPVGDEELRLSLPIAEADLENVELEDGHLVLSGPLALPYNVGVLALESPAVEEGTS